MGDLLRFSALLRGESNLLVFISSVMTDDLKCARETAVTTLRALHFVHPWAFELTPASSETPSDAYLRKVEEADFVIWLIGTRRRSRW